MTHPTEGQNRTENGTELARANDAHLGDDDAWDTLDDARAFEVDQTTSTRSDDEFEWVVYGCLNARSNESCRMGEYCADCWTPVKVPKKATRE